MLQQMIKILHLSTLNIYIKTAPSVPSGHFTTKIPPGTCNGADFFVLLMSQMSNNNHFVAE